jgi:hypothetical protein
MKRFFIFLVAMILFGIHVYASNICLVLDTNGNRTTDTINVNVSSFDNKTGKVVVVVSSDSDKPVNAYLTITVDGNAKLSNQSIRVEPFFSGVKEYNIGAWGKTSSTVQVDISGAKCLN